MKRASDFSEALFYLLRGYYLRQKSVTIFFPKLADFAFLNKIHIHVKRIFHQKLKSFLDL